eukprot:g2003.t1
MSAPHFARASAKAICAGRNYVAHARELNNPLPSKPFFFVKPSSTFLPFGGVPFGGDSGTPNLVEFPRANELHHELELSVIIGKKARKVNEETALDYVEGYCISLEMTLRDEQAIMKEKRLPWTSAKAFDTSLALGHMIPAEKIPDPAALDLWLDVDGEARQAGPTSNMIFSVPRLIADASQLMTLYPGDIVCTGTPEGVGQVFEGQRLQAGIRGFPEFDIEIGCKAVD